MKRKIKTKGFTLIETLLVVGFVALASVGVYSIYNKAQAISIANDESVLLEKFKNDIVKMYETEASYAGLDNTVLNTAKVTPNSMRDNTANNIINQFGGAVVVSPIPFGGNPNRGFAIAYPRVKSSSCTNIAITLADRFDRITINGTQVKAYGDRGIAPAAVADACNDAGDAADLNFDYISTFMIFNAPPVPPMTPSPQTRFSMAPNDVVCDRDSPNFMNGDAAIPRNVRNQLIFTYKSIPNHAGLCPPRADYENLLTLVTTHKATNPTLNYTEVYTNIVEPLIIADGSDALYADSITTGATFCTNASNAVFGAIVPSTYMPNTGNKCRPL